MTALSVPVWGRLGSTYWYMKFQMTPAATKLIASGRKITDLATALVADAVDEDRDQQAEAPRPRRS